MNRKRLDPGSRSLYWRIKDEYNRPLGALKGALDASVDRSVPIRLTQTPARCRVHPRAGIKVGIGRRLNTARDAEQRAEGVERVETPVEAERELIEVGL
jgi:hypothetical protein